MTAPEHPPFVTFLSDFGTSDDFAGICHGVINLLCPDARVIHITHGIQPQAIGQGARVLAGAIQYLPVGVHLAVVDPGRRLRAAGGGAAAGDGRHFVGPDNGLLIPAAEACGGVVEAVAITNPRHHAAAGLAHVPRPRRVRAGRRAAGLRDAAFRARPGHRAGPARAPLDPGPPHRGDAAARHRPVRRPVRQHPAGRLGGRARRPLPGRPHGRDRHRRRPLLRRAARTRSPTSGRASSSSTRTRWGCCRSPSTRATRPS